jgi:hypothetical protein
VVHTTTRTRASAGAWSDRFIARLARWPGPLWLTLAGLILAGILFVHGVEWFVGDLPLGHFDPSRATYPVYPFGILGLIAAQKHVAMRALEQFRPASGLDDAEYQAAAASIKYQPARVTFVATLAFGLLGILIESSTEIAPMRRAAFPIAYGVDLVVAFAGYMMTGPWLVGVVRLIGRVSRLHREAPRVDLLNPEPVRAFSSATAVVGASLLAITTLSLVTETGVHGTPAGLMLTVLLVGFAFASFATPLWGMHRRLLAERARLLSDVGLRLETTIGRLYEHVDEDRPGISEMRDRMSALVAARDLIAQQSTWPWSPETLRWLISALVIPILLWGATRMLESVVFLTG